MPAYATATDVSDFMQRDAFGASTVPTLTAVNTWIDEAERNIERITNRAYGTKTVRITDFETSDFEYHDIWPHHYTYTFVNKPRVYLKHPNIITPLATASGDSMQVWDGSAYTEWVGVKTEGRNGDFWLNGNEGIVYFNRGYPLIRYPEGVRLKYRYTGAAVAVEPWVRDITVKVVALKVMEFDTKTMTAAGGAGNPEVLGISDRARHLREEIDKVLDENSWLSRDRRPLIL